MEKATRDRRNIDLSKIRIHFIEWLALIYINLVSLIYNYIIKQRIDLKLLLQLTFELKYD